MFYFAKCNLVGKSLHIATGARIILLSTAYMRRAGEKSLLESQSLFIARFLRARGSRLLTCKEDFLQRWPSIFLPFLSSCLRMAAQILQHIVSSCHCFISLYIYIVVSSPPLCLVLLCVYIKRCRDRSSSSSSYPVCVGGRRGGRGSLLLFYYSNDQPM